MIPKAFQVTLLFSPRMFLCVRGAGFSLWAENNCVYFCDRKSYNYWTFCRQSKHNYFILTSLDTSLLFCQLICRAVLGVRPHYYVPRYSFSTCSAAVAICQFSHKSVVSITYEQNIIYAKKLIITYHIWSAGRWQITIFCSTSLISIRCRCWCMLNLIFSATISTMRES